VNVSHILAALPVGLEPLTSGTWNVFFGPVHTWAGWMNETIAFMTAEAALNVNATCYPSGDNKCYPSAETFSSPILEPQAQQQHPDHC
jgi:hypothetical protein